MLQKRRATVADEYDHCSATHGTMQLGIHGEWWHRVAVANGTGAYSTEGVAAFVRAAHRKSVWAIHTGGTRSRWRLLEMVVGELEREFPLPPASP